MKNTNQISEEFQNFKITTYHFKEENGDKINCRDNDFYYKYEDNDDEVDEITIRKYYEK